MAAIIDGSGFSIVQIRYKLNFLENSERFISVCVFKTHENYSAELNVWTAEGCCNR